MEISQNNNRNKIKLYIKKKKKVVICKTSEKPGGNLCKKKKEKNEKLSKKKTLEKCACVDTIDTMYFFNKANTVLSINLVLSLPLSPYNFFNHLF